MATMSLTATREAASRILSIRAAQRALKDEADTLTASLRPSLARWGAVLTDGRAVYVTDDSERVSPDADALATLARAHGATDAEIAACVKRTPVAGSVRDRNPRQGDR